MQKEIKQKGLNQRMVQVQNCIKQYVIDPVKIFVESIMKLVRAILTMIIVAFIFGIIALIQNCTGSTGAQNVKKFIKWFCRFFSINRLIQKISNFIFQKILVQYPVKIKSFIQKLSNPKGQSFPHKYIKLKQQEQQKLEKGLNNTSNQVLLHIQELKTNQYKKKSLTYFVPTYLRVLFKNFTALDLVKLQAQMNVDIIITFIYGNKGLLKLPKQVATRLGNEVILNFERDEPLRLQKSNDISMKEKQDRSQITFTIRKKIHAQIDSDVYYTPFQKVYLLLPITIQQLPPATIQNPFKLSQSDSEYTYEAGVKFNYMDRPNTKFVTLDYKTNQSFGYYSLAPSQLQAKYHNKKLKSTRQQVKQKQLEKNKEIQKGIRKIVNHQKTSKNAKTNKLLQTNKSLQTNDSQNDPLLKSSKPPKQEQQKPPKQKKQKLPNNHQYSLFQISTYKHPTASLVMIFLPLWSLAIINLGVYFQDSSLPQRIASIASLMIAFIALNEIIRSAIPPYPNIVFVELLIYAQIAACFFTLINSLEIRDIKDYHMKWDQNIYFILSVLILIIQMLIIGYLFIHYCFIELPGYSLDQNLKQWKKAKKEMKHVQWRNDQCDKNFKQLIVQIPQLVKQYSLDWCKKISDLNDQLVKQRQNRSQSILDVLVKLADHQEQMKMKSLKELNTSRSQKPMESVSRLLNQNFYNQSLSVHSKLKQQQTKLGSENMILGDLSN